MAYEFFSHDELTCKHCGLNLMEASFMARLIDFRKAWNEPMQLSSAYRCPVHNQRVSTTGAHGPHTTGRAVDILVAGQDALELVALAIAYNFGGIGVSQKGPHATRFIHLDDLDNAMGQPRPFIWSY